MPDFAYIARDADGQKVTGTLSAGSEREVLSLLSGESLFPVEVTPEKPKGSPLSRKRVGAQLMATTYSQLAALIRSGVPLLPVREGGLDNRVQTYGLARNRGKGRGQYRVRLLRHC